MINHTFKMVHPRTHRPTSVFEEFSAEGRTFKSKKLPTVTKHVSPKDVRFVCISDTHSRLGKILDRIPFGDVLLHAGDFTCSGSYREVVTFNEDIGKLPHTIKIVIAGNHELTFDPGITENGKAPFMSDFHKANIRAPQELLTNCLYLEDAQVDVYGYKVYGSPWQPRFCDWAFNVERGDRLLRVWNKIPPDADILVTHGPPLGHGDFAKNGQRAGCVELLNTVESRVKPKFHVFGHIHEGYGVTTNDVTTFINCSICTVTYKPANPPVVFDLPLLAGQKKLKKETPEPIQLS